MTINDSTGTALPTSSLDGVHMGSMSHGPDAEKDPAFAANDVRTAAVLAVVALMPGFDSSDDGGGEYIFLPSPDGVEDHEAMLFVLGEGFETDTNKWQYQTQDGQTVHRSATLTVDSAPQDVLAWLRKITA